MKGICIHNSVSVCVVECSLSRAKIRAVGCSSQIYKGWFKDEQNVTKE